MSSNRRKSRFGSPIAIGAVLLVLSIVVLLAVYQKERVSTMLSSGDEVQAEFNRAYRVIPAKSDVKIAGVVVGTVTDVAKGEGDKTLVSMKVWGDTTDKLGSEPSAIVRPTTLLGGNYYVELQPGGDRQKFSGDPIPVERTSVPSELDKILGAIPGRAQESIQNTTRLTDESLRAGAGDSVGNLLEHAPQALGPAGEVFSSVRGTNPEKDLYQIVPQLNTVAVALTQRDGQLGHTIDSLGDVSATLGQVQRPLADSIEALPATLSATRGGLDALHGSLDRLTATAGNARPAAQELGPLLAKADPVVREARPMVAELRPLLQDVRPLVGRLVPTAQQATSTLNHVNGPVLDRINGPIANAVLSPWKGTGAYEGNGGTGHKLYEEVGYLASHSANLSKYGNKNGRMLGLGLGVGVSTVGGNDPGTAQLLQSLGLLPGGVEVLPPPDQSGDDFSRMPATSPGKDHFLPRPGGLVPGTPQTQGN
ncbi:MlaD family protein [Saccharopolyspora endophytica]|uniref:MCE family protein n=1 Tax=Saccharopolyspora endophytica TaxID=543886 RepID=A0ABS5DB79_9PSEU|nr:MlaD family protein [Saccharopolyspora endophytica]MBQ0923534.1 MCE family protein [Saccharopolyspora endophytica]